MLTSYLLKEAEYYDSSKERESELIGLFCTGKFLRPAKSIYYRFVGPFRDITKCMSYFEMRIEYVLHSIRGLSPEDMKDLNHHELISCQHGGNHGKHAKSPGLLE